jgi:hypothetical protein
MEKSIKKSARISVEIPGNHRTLNPPVGGFFRLDGRIYKALSTDQYSCSGCCFFHEKTNSIGCHIPVCVDCDMKVFKDVTNVFQELGVELIDEDPRKVNIWPLLILLGVAIWGIIISIII